METMYFAPLRLTLAAPPDLRASEAGTALTLSSVGGRIPAPRLLPYVAAEFAAAGFSQGLRAELAGTGVSVTTVLPGLVRTGSHTAARFHGRPGAEYGWFATAASMPVLSMDAERAARANRPGRGAGPTRTGPHPCGEARCPPAGGRARHDGAVARPRRPDTARRRRPAAPRRPSPQRTERDRRV